jgi:streptogramin lyase
MPTSSPKRFALCFVVLALGAPGCGKDTTVTPQVDGGQPRVDQGGGQPDLAMGDQGSDAGADAGTDASVDAGFDVGVDAGSDSGTDAGSDAGFDAGTDAGMDAGFDGGPDASVDGGFPTAIACPGWLGLPTGGVTLVTNSPEGLRVGPDCALYASLNDSVYRIEQGTGVITEFATQPTEGTGFQGLDFGPDGNLYVAARTSANVILRFNGTTGAFIDVFANMGINGPNTPRFGPDGRLYVSCRNTGNVVRFDPDGTELGEFATHPSLGSPEGLSFGPDGHLYVAARTNSVVMRFNGNTGAFMNEIIVTPGFMAPEGLGFTSDGSLWIASRDTSEVIQVNGLTFAEVNRFSLPTGEEPIGLEVVDDQVVVSLRGTGRVTIVP